MEHMKGKFVFLLTLSLLLSCPSLTRANHSEIGASSTYPVHNLNTGLNYTTIQDAVSAPETQDGNTIEVDAGTYYEHLTVSKSVFLLGESRNATIIDGSGVGPVLLLSANNVTIANFTIRNGGYAFSPMDTCIFGKYLSNILIENNTLMDASSGIIFYGYHNSSMSNNLAEGCTVMGLHLDSCADCKMENNTVIDSFQGIVLEKTVGNSVQRNYVADSNVSIDLYASAGNLVDGNSFMDNSIGMVLDSCNGSNDFRNNNVTSDAYDLIVWGSSIGAFMQNIDTSNMANNGTIYYVTDSDRLTLDPLNCPNVGYLALVNCSDATVKDVDLSDDKDGMLMAQSTGCSLINITVANMRANLTLIESNGASIHAVLGGLTFFESDNNTIIDSRITNNSVGVCLYQSSGNLFYHNSFADIDEPVISNFQSPTAPPSGSYSENEWDNGLEGNYWSNYNGTDSLSGPYQNESGSDGIGDTPYNIDANNTDHYPLMGTFSQFSVNWAGREYSITTISNSTVSDFALSVAYPHISGSNWTTTVAFNLTSGNPSFCRVMIPKDVLDGQYTVTIDGLTAPLSTWRQLPTTNDTMLYLYLNSSAGSHQVSITGTTTVAEFPAYFTLSALIVTTLTALIVYKKGRKQKLHASFLNNP
jgi:parallel beta-helix repeat protein